MTGIHQSALNALAELNRGDLDLAGEVITTIYPKFYRDPLLGPYLNDAQRFIEDRGVHGVSYNDSGTAKFAQCVYLYLLLEGVRSLVLLNVLETKGDQWSLTQAHHQWAVMYDPTYAAPDQVKISEKEPASRLFGKIKAFSEQHEGNVMPWTPEVEQLLDAVKAEYRDFLVDREFLLLLKDLHSGAAFYQELEDEEYPQKFQRLIQILERIEDKTLFLTVKERALAKGAEIRDIHEFIDQLLAEGKIAPADAKNYKAVKDTIEVIKLQKVLAAL